MYKYVKRMFDIILSLIFIILSLPIMLLTYIVLKIDIGGKMIYKQERLGINKKIFVIYKFKTCVDDTSIPDRDRRTKISMIVRQTGFDELPQLFNILKGDMSIVGPRPYMAHDDTMPKSAHNPKRYKVKPGLLGMAQAKGRRWISYEDKMKWDLKYVDEISFWTDFKLFWQTCWTVFLQFIDFFR